MNATLGLVAQNVKHSGMKAYTIGNMTAPAGLPEIERTVSEIGAKVARARAERGWSLAQLAQRAGMSPGAVHKIEKSGMTPTIATLMKIAAALGKSVAYFVDELENPDVNVIRGDERARVYTSKQGLDLRNLSGRYGGFAMAGAEAVFEPFADSGPTPMNHPGEELVIVLEGRMEFEVDGECHRGRHDAPARDLPVDPVADMTRAHRAPGDPGDGQPREPRPG